MSHTVLPGIDIVFLFTESRAILPVPQRRRLWSPDSGSGGEFAVLYQIWMPLTETKLVLVQMTVSISLLWLLATVQPVLYVNGKDDWRVGHRPKCCVSP